MQKHSIHARASGNRDNRLLGLFRCIVGMSNEIKSRFLGEVETRFGSLRKIGDGQSLYEIGRGQARIYIRYSKLHGRGQGFYGLRLTDLKELTGHASLICFLWDGQECPLLIPFGDYELVFDNLKPADDGQFKVMVYPGEEATELFINRAGRFNVDAFVGWEPLEQIAASSSQQIIPDLSHNQIQTLLGSIGNRKGFNVWIPRDDRIQLDWSVAERFSCFDQLPPSFESIKGIAQEVDVIWLNRGTGLVTALFEVEHSTPIYSGLLRFNDVHLTLPTFKPRFNIVAKEVRRDLFVRQINRPTFISSGLNELCTFLEYVNVFTWHQRVKINERK